MTETLDAVSAAMEEAVPTVEELELARELVRRAREQGASMSAPGLMRALTRSVLETALDEELAEHLGYDKHDPAGYNTGNSRNGTRTTTVLTDAVGPVTIEVPRDREGSFEPVIVRKHQRRLGQVDEIILSLTARGPTTRGGECALRRDLRGVGVQGHDLTDHGSGHRGDAGVADPPVGVGIRGGIH
jgi:transposase-like protein